jgi:hypothetical protein
MEATHMTNPNTTPEATSSTLVASIIQQLSRNVDDARKESLRAQDALKRQCGYFVEGVERRQLDGPLTPSELLSLSMSDATPLCDMVARLVRARAAYDAALDSLREAQARVEFAK